MNEHNPHYPPPPRPTPDGAGPAEAARADPARPETAGPQTVPPSGEAPPRPPPVIRIAGRTIPMPASRIVRIALGTALVVFGLLGFLPILGFWMVPLGLLILSIDIAIVRRWRRRSAVWMERRFPGFWAKLKRWTTHSHLRGDGDRR